MNILLVMKNIEYYNLLNFYVFLIIIFEEKKSFICILENGNDSCVLFTCFYFLLRLIYSALHRYMKLARYVGQLEVEKYV